MKKLTYIMIMLVGLFWFPSCESTMDESLEEITKQTNGYADLVLSMNTPELNVSSRSLSNDPKNAGGSWSEWEKFVDGALLYHVTLFVIDSSGTLVGYRDIYSGSNDVNASNGFYETGTVNTSATTGIAVKAAFQSANPMHGSIEKLKPGTYKLVAVANYSSVTSNDNTYAGLGNANEDGTDNYNGSSDFSSIVSTALNGFSQSAGLAGFTQTGDAGQEFFTYQLNAGEDRVCKLLPQPLVMIREVTLKSGANYISGLLSRTFARVRLDVKNVDESAVIGVSELTFNGAYASQKAYLFNDVAAGDVNLYSHFALYDDTQGALSVSSEDAIVPAPTQIERLPVGVTYNIFDCYILEGQIAASYAFNFTASYWTSSSGGGATQNYQITQWGPTGSSGNGSGILDYLVFIRIDTNNSTTLFQADATNKKVVTSDAGSAATDGSSTPLNPSYIWEIVPSETPMLSSQIGVAYGYLQSIGSSLYLQAYNGATDMTAQVGYDKSSLIFKINFSGQDEKGSIYCVYNNQYYYLDSSGTWVLDSSTTSVTTSAPSTYQRLTFETITGEKGTQVDETVEQTIKMYETTGTIPTNEIRRNDFFWGTIPVKVN